MNKIYLSFWVQPNAPRTQINGYSKERESWLLQLKAPALENKANEELLRYVAQLVGCSKQSFELKAGQTSRKKIVIHHCKLCTLECLNKFFNTKI